MSQITKVAAFEGEEDISSKGSGLDMKFSVDLDTNRQDEELMMKLNASVDEALFSKALVTKSKKLPMQVGVRDDGEMCKDFSFSKKVSLKMYHNTLGLRRMTKDKTFENQNTNTEESEMKKKDVISPYSISSLAILMHPNLQNGFLNLAMKYLRTKKVKKT